MKILKNRLIMFITTLITPFVHGDKVSSSNSLVDTAMNKMYIVPQPKSIISSNDVFRLNNDIVIISGDETMIAALDLQKELLNVCGIECKIAPSNGSTGMRAITLRVGGLGANDSVNKEGYTLIVDSNNIVIRSKTPEGVFYGVQTLKQLLRGTGCDLIVPGCQINDEPALGMRGIVLYIGETAASAQSMASLKRIIDTFAQLKLNTILLWFGANIQFDRHPLVSAKNAFSKKQIAELIAYAKARYFEVIPYFQMFSHAPWILNDPQKVSLLEDPSNKGWQAAWCPSNPDVYKFIDDVLEETMVIFKPRYCFVGLDELNHCPFGICEQCSKAKPSQLFLKMIMSLHDNLKARGIKMVMYSDTLRPESMHYVHKVYGNEILDQVPREVIITEWGTGNDPLDVKNRIEYFTRKGFHVFPESTVNPQSIQTLNSVLAKASNVLGHFGVYWYEVKDWTNVRMVSPLAWRAVVLGAQYSWNPINPPLKKIHYDPIYKVRQMYGPKRSLVEKGIWQSVPLERVFNGRISDNDESWPGYGIDNSLAQVFSKDIVCSDDVTFHIGSPKKANVVLMSGGSDDGLTRQPITIPLHRKTLRLAFLHACNIPSNRDELFGCWQNALAMPTVANYRINYEDGTFCDLPLLYRWNIMDWNGKTGTFEGQIAYEGKTKDGARIQFLRTDWENPSPEKIVKSITVSTAANKGMSLALFAVSSKNLDTDTIKNRSASTESAMTVDGFEYSSVKQVESAWKITCLGFDGTVQVHLNTKEMKEGKKCLELILPPTKDQIARVCLDVFPKVTVKDHEQVRFWIWMDHWDSADANMLYWADNEWKNYFYVSNFLSGGIKKGNWKKVFISRSAFKIDGGNPEMGNPTWDMVNQFRISLWIKANQPANRILIDEIIWDSEEKRMTNFNRDWWED